MNNAHHAILCRADSVVDFELPLSDTTVEVSDFYSEKFGIDDARELVRKSNNRPLDADQQLLVVRTNFISLEAQNALLKVLEEPPVSTRFIFVVPQDFVVLPTLISRFSSESTVESNSVVVENEVFNTFLTQEYKDRLASIDVSAKKQDVGWQRSIKQGLAQHIKNQSSTNLDSLVGLEYVTRLMLTRGASNKMLLEQAALLLPAR